MKTIFIFISLIPFAAWTQVPGFEFHASANLPLNQGGIYFGAGVGGNILFRENKIFNFKTGVECNFFHTWESSVFAGSMGSNTDVHYKYGVLSFPAIVRFSFGNEYKLFIETGVYLGVGYGQMKYTYVSYSPYSSGSKSNRSEDYFPGLTITPTVGLGGRIPLSTRIDLLLKSEFALNITDFDFDDKAFESWYIYPRFCAGIHLKPKPKKPTKHGVIKIEPLHP